MQYVDAEARAREALLSALQPQHGFLRRLVVTQLVGPVADAMLALARDVEGPLLERVRVLEGRAW